MSTLEQPSNFKILSPSSALRCSATPHEPDAVDRSRRF
jgi:hypothetical protein